MNTDACLRQRERAVTTTQGLVDLDESDEFVIQLLGNVLCCGLGHSHQRRSHGGRRCLNIASAATCRQSNRSRAGGPSRLDRKLEVLFTVLMVVLNLKLKESVNLR